MSKPWQGAALLAETPDAEALWRHGPVRLGYIDYLNCLPVYYGIEHGINNLPVAVKVGPPTQMTRMFLHGELDIAPIPAIEFARHHGDCVLLPDLSISADGRVASIFLFSKVPVAEIRTVALTSASATSVVLTKIILGERYGLRPQYITMPSDLRPMLAAADACLIIGDDALLTLQAVQAGRHGDLVALDLGEEWKALTGEVMVFALWVIRREFAERSPGGIRLVARLLAESQAYAWAHRDEMVAEALRRRDLPRAVIEDYFNTIRHGFGPAYRRGLLTYLRYAQKLGELENVPDLHVWGEAH